MKIHLVNNSLRLLALRCFVENMNTFKHICHESLTTSSMKCIETTRSALKKKIEFVNLKTRTKIVLQCWWPSFSLEGIKSSTVSDKRFAIYIMMTYLPDWMTGSQSSQFSLFQWCRWDDMHEFHFNSRTILSWQWNTDITCIWTVFLHGVTPRQHSYTQNPIPVVVGMSVCLSGICHTLALCQQDASYRIRKSILTNSPRIIVLAV